MILKFLRILLTAVKKILKSTNFLVKKIFFTKKSNNFPQDDAGGRTYFWASMPEFIFVIIILLILLVRFIR
ncbi:hypothetical protein [uncultured Gammaproteobacteria bacterium]|jgi:hypothetical protein|nr:hypothetical protein BROOK1789B_2221 [Bathymodiolus brooksi thiotrophic gill symbiont]CAC9555760.1 hypothetical protein [uncultured Gammaproteobacteria bacterium]CAB9544310.1 hypothetical protein BROOK1789C_1585 [Bathymodiolus brooksi thiotrophic gill symbiont]CAC9556067.1 hypothetical protein [uncultured Gammaproteobacteria bacterium]CAC9560705.1 hypothetical protein [uncultured Gammaproteobacteria bacterium]